MKDTNFICKNAAKRYTLGVVYEPDTVDSHGDFATMEEIEHACWAFNRKLQGRLSKILNALSKAADGGVLKISVPLTKGMLGVQHNDWSDDNGDIVESYIAPVDMTIEGESVHKGTWLMGVVWSPENWDRINKGELTGYSLGGFARLVPSDA